jgi:hypothetical protein
MGTQTFTYNFGAAGSLSITVNSTAQSSTLADGSGPYTGYTITGISGTLSGQTVSSANSGLGSYGGGSGQAAALGVDYDNIIFTGNTQGSGGSNYGIDFNWGILFQGTSGDYYELSYAGGGTNNFSFNDASTTLSVGSGTYTLQSSNAPCYVTGTRIRTTRGDVAIEDLEVGDLAVTASGARRPIKWIGHCKMDLRRHPHPEEVLPVRISRDAFGPGRPERDLYVSRGHAICVDLVGEILVPARALVNGSTIAQVERDEVVYWHVELDSHDILLAENLPAESFIDMGNRHLLIEAGAPLDSFGPESGNTHADYCRPLVWDGEILTFLRQRLDARALTLGWTPSRDAELRLSVDGELSAPRSELQSAPFVLSSGARDVRLRSNRFTPSKLRRCDDHRELGVSLKELVFVDETGDSRRISACDERLHGLHPEEAQMGAGWRWTNGEIVLPPELWAGMVGEILLFVRHDRDIIRKWVAPEEKAPAIQTTTEAKPRLYAVQ